jgi:hypothetical protein
MLILSISALVGLAQGTKIYRVRADRRVLRESEDDFRIAEGDLPPARG